MRIAIIGSGGREHSICQKIYESRNVNSLFCIPGNGGTENIATNVEINLKDFEKIKNFLKEKVIDLTIVGPEEPLVNGIVDFLRKHDLNVFGPDKFCSKLEGSKIFTKKICDLKKIPTANFKILNNLKNSIKYLENKKYPLVVKADGLAAGKGVYICNNFLDAKKAVKEIFDGKFGEAKEVLIEDFLEGEEMSFFLLYDNKSFKVFNTAQDHKRVFEGDKGKNTGGMGAYSPSRLISRELEEKIIKKIILPTLNYLKKENGKYIGFLYAGLMIKNNEPYLIEYNVRMGDPECQTILPLLENDFLDVLVNCVNGNLENINLKWKNKKSLCIVLTSKGYPEKFKNNILIENLNNIENNTDQFIFHAGTKLIKEKYYSTGGRVLNIVMLERNYKHARNKCINLIDKINWNNGHYRKDIGYKVIDEI
ncbi:phosphoribosylamine--glycine ligase [Candidatus Pelagibacter sp.]|nr:phosphoribosylamine--glycine ligase [Candidatus Pelagibacter sp.]